jgi:ATPase subunit of ABC transporter with duplicated ATPase domains
MSLCVFKNCKSRASIAGKNHAKMPPALVHWWNYHFNRQTPYRRQTLNPSFAANICVDFGPPTELLTASSGGKFRTAPPYVLLIRQSLVKIVSPGFWELRRVGLLCATVMARQIIQIRNYKLSFSHRVCIEKFTQDVSAGDRIALIGRNGSGKSVLLRSICGDWENFTGSITRADGVIFASVPQISDETDGLSCGQYFNKKLSQALACVPDVLILDEPTNHLDLHNRRSLMAMLNRFPGTLLFATHDEELLYSCARTLWYMADGAVRVFHGNYADFCRDRAQHRDYLEREIAAVKRERGVVLEKKIQEQKRARKSRETGIRKAARLKFDKMTAFAKSQVAESSRGKKLVALERRREELAEKLSSLSLPEPIIPTFHMDCEENPGARVVTIRDGIVSHDDHTKAILRDIQLTIHSRERIAILGNNGSGKTSLIRAIIGDPAVFRWGQWEIIAPAKIGYLSQSYANVDREKSALDNLSAVAACWPEREMRKHLSAFLFRKNEEVQTAAKFLSGGERARLSLALIAARTPALLILDEITNNIDQETRNHVITVLKNFPGALLLVSHDENFLSQIAIAQRWNIPARTGGR